VMIVQVNVKTYAGSTTTTITNASDYGSGFSVAFTALGTTEDQRTWTTIHEAGGHGFGKLCDEYEGNAYTTFNVSYWNDLDNLHQNFSISDEIRSRTSSIEPTPSIS
jgi:hypothetical protein